MHAISNHSKTSALRAAANFVSALVITDVQINIVSYIINKTQALIDTRLMLVLFVDITEKFP